LGFSILASFSGQYHSPVCLVGKPLEHAPPPFAPSSGHTRRKYDKSCWRRDQRSCWPGSP
jgi:hypothetical protein